jgi:hypothetical protein
VLVSLLLLVLIAAGLLYFETTATVTITLPSHSYSLPLPVKLEATTNSQDKLHNTVASQVLSYDASVSGSGLASGTAPVGSVSATGQVYITNHGTQLVTIPSKIVLTTTGGTGGVGFITTANAVALPGDFVPVMVQAQTPGTSGNVGPNTITVIPPESLAAIASFDGINSAQLNLSVTNPAALSGGGAQLVPAVTNGDLQALKVSLHQQLQTKFKAWLKEQVHPDDLRGTPAPDVLGNALPLAQEHLTGTPALNTPLSGKSFTGVLTAHISVLVVRAASIAAVAQARLNAAALAMRPAAYMLATQLPIKLAKSNLNPSKDGTSISFNLSASGQIIPLVNTQDVSMYISGKTKDQAISDIESGDAGTRGVENVTIQVSPSILSIMPFRTEHIYIIVVPDPGRKALPKH